MLNVHIQAQGRSATATAEKLEGYQHVCICGSLLLKYKVRHQMRRVMSAVCCAEAMDADGYESADEGVRGIEGTPPDKKTIAQLKEWLTDQGHEEKVMIVSSCVLLAEAKHAAIEAGPCTGASTMMLLFLYAARGIVFSEMHASRSDAYFFK